jgi:ubiquinone/menaquinone biosynthesis C-methylase UbiE
MELVDLIKREKQKYNSLYSSDEKYGWKSGRPKVFLRGNDEIHTVVKKIFKESNTMLDIGCGRGFFTDALKIEYPNLKISYVDIAAKEIRKYRPDLNIIEASANNLFMFKDNHFDVVTHLDGMEHIPIEIEKAVIKEEIRVSKKYVYHQIATHPVNRDKIWIDKGLGAIHINLKTFEEWKNSFEEYAKEFNFNILNCVDFKLWTHIILEKLND